MVGIGLLYFFCLYHLLITGLTYNLLGRFPIKKLLVLIAVDWLLAGLAWFAGCINPTPFRSHFNDGKHGRLR